MKAFKLDDHPKLTPGFQVPEAYFEGLSQKILAKLPPQQPKVIPLYRKRRHWIMAAAAVLVVTLMLPIYNGLNRSTDTLDQASLENYLSDQSGLSQQELVNLLDRQDIDALDQDLQLEDQAIEDVLTTNNDLENYITE